MDHRTLAAEAIAAAQHQGEAMTDRIPIDAERLVAFIDHALETHPEAAQLKGLLDMGATRAIAIVADEVELHIAHPDQEGTLHIASWPVADVTMGGN